MEASAGSLPVCAETPSTLMFRTMAHAAPAKKAQAAKLAAHLTAEFPPFTVENFIPHYEVSSPPAREAIRAGAKLANFWLDLTIEVQTRRREVRYKTNANSKRAPSPMRLDFNSASDCSFSAPEPPQKPHAHKSSPEKGEGCREGYWSQFSVECSNIA